MPFMWIIATELHTHRVASAEVANKRWLSLLRNKDTPEGADINACHAGIASLVFDNDCPSIGILFHSSLRTSFDAGRSRALPTDNNFCSPFFSVLNNLDSRQSGIYLTKVHQRANGFAVAAASTYIAIGEESFSTVTHGVVNHTFLVHRQRPSYPASPEYPVLACPLCPNPAKRSIYPALPLASEE